MKMHWLLFFIFSILAVHSAKLYGQSSHIEDRNIEHSANFVIRSRRVVEDLEVVGGSLNHINNNIEEMETFEKDYKIAGGSVVNSLYTLYTYTRATYFTQWIRDHVFTSGSTGDRPSQHTTLPQLTAEPFLPQASPRPPYVSQIYNPHPIADQQNTPPPFVPQTYTPQSVASQPNPSIIATETCSCSDFVNKNGFGRCKKKDSDFGGSFSCYVNLPSNCPDLVRSGTQPGKFLSAQSCKSNPIGPLSSSGLVNPTSNPRQTNKPASGCSCSDFINRNGFGQCKKEDSDFAGAFSCYVKLPSTCQDLIRSVSNPNEFLSAEACERA